MVWFSVLQCSDQTKKRKSMWSFILFLWSVALGCHLQGHISFVTWFKHFNIIQKTWEVFVHAPICCGLGNLSAKKCMLSGTDCSELVAFLVEAILPTMSCDTSWKQQERDGAVDGAVGMPHCDFDLEDSIPIVLQDTPAHDSTKFGYKRLSSLEEIFWTILDTLTDRKTYRHSDSSIRP